MKRAGHRVPAAGVSKRAAGGIAMNPSMGAPARTSLCATVPPTALLDATAARACCRARFGTGCDVHAAPRGGLAPTCHGTLVHIQEGFRDRARQDVAPGAPMDGFMAFAETLLNERQRAARSLALARREARP
jgi:hypothetical protein